MQYTVTIPMVPPSLNAYTRMHWSARRKLHETWDYAVWALAREQRIPRMAKIHVEVTIFFATNRRRDMDNYVTAFKLLNDALVTAGVVDDDSPDYLTFSLPTFAHGEPHTVVTLSPLP